jgi:hypothetical protein
MAKYELWQKNPWHAIYWMSKFQTLIGQPINEKVKPVQA